MVIAKERVNNDLSHDFNHLYRVLKLAETISKRENADLDIVVPAALFHDIVVYKGTPKYKYEVEESAAFAEKTLGKISEYPKNKIGRVRDAILSCSYSKNINPAVLEAKVLQDADLLEATGAISIMRTFSSSAAMNRSFYSVTDPLCQKRKPDDKTYSLDLFFTRLLVADKRMNTLTAKKIAHRRIAFLRKFLVEFGQELKESDDRVRLNS